MKVVVLFSCFGEGRDGAGGQLGVGKQRPQSFMQAAGDIQ